MYDGVQGNSCDNVRNANYGTENEKCQLVQETPENEVDKNQPHPSKHQSVHMIISAVIPGPESCV